MADEQQQQQQEQPSLVAGHPPAVKAGGMRIVQHKPATAERAAKDAEDCTGLTQPVNVNTVTVSGATVKGHIDYTPQAAQVAHQPKPPAHVQHKPHVNIQQPRK